MGPLAVLRRATLADVWEEGQSPLCDWASEPPLGLDAHGRPALRSPAGRASEKTGAAAPPLRAVAPTFRISPHNLRRIGGGHWVSIDESSTSGGREECCLREGESWEQSSTPVLA